MASSYLSPFSSLRLATAFVHGRPGRCIQGRAHELTGIKGFCGELSTDRHTTVNRSTSRFSVAWGHKGFRARTELQRKRAEDVMPECTHLGSIREVQPHSAGCEECLKTGDPWVHLRLCLTCGHVGCCDSSPNRHAAKHFHKTHHPLVRSFEPGENWAWCYVDQVTLMPA
jgi:uncharacterized UBP type Zn finger protein